MYKQFINSPFANVLKREIDRITGNWIYLFITLLGPLFSFIIVMNIFVAGVPSDVPVALVDNDNTALSRQLGRMVDATRTVKISAALPTLESARDQMMKGHVNAVLYIPSDFEKQIQTGKSQPIELFINNSNVLKGSLIQSAIYKTAATMSTGVKLQVAMKQGIPQTQAMEQVYPLRLDQHILFNPFTNYSYFLVTALMPLLLVVFTLLGTIYTMGMEIRQGTAKNWLKAANQNMVIALAGKFLPYLFLMLVNTGVMNYILAHHLGFALKGNWLTMMIGQTLMLIAYQAAAIILLSLSGNTRLALSLGSAYSMMALTFSGLTFPVFGMPLLARIFAHLFPFYYWMQIFMSQGLRAAPVYQTAIPIIAMLLFILIGFLLTPRLKSIMTNKFYQQKI
ncbi:ABC transporter permease [Geofilum sp. OHC36d9]|uniref:ABC transporter permease n=1 Tax=Geofilum sp. OHC36d9 TaxID=3458413 RepID=UPI004034057F